jgi:hypothetical protein
VRRLLSILAALSLGLGAPARAQPTTNEDEIVVTGERLHDMIRSFVEDLEPQNLPEDRVARWDSRVCPLLVGIPARQAQYVIDRISQRAFDLGLRPGGPGCRANVLIFITSDADTLAQTLASDRHLVAYYNDGEFGRTQGRDALARFVASDAPVRWWHVSQGVSENGVVEPKLARSNGTRLQSAIRLDFNRALIVVDARLADGLAFEALADYLAMVSLAQLDAEADTSEIPTILNVFDERASGRPPIVRMTDWDLAYLEGLYAAPGHAPNLRSQRRAITRRMDSVLQPPAEP